MYINVYILVRNPIFVNTLAAVGCSAIRAVSRDIAVPTQGNDRTSAKTLCATRLSRDERL